jgi:hypothetical protein
MIALEPHYEILWGPIANKDDFVLALGVFQARLEYHSRRQFTMNSFPLVIRLILIGTLTLSMWPTQIAAQIQPLEQALRLVKEAENDATDNAVREGLKNIRKDLERARDQRKDGKSEQAAQEIQAARGSLRTIIDSPGKESDLFQEKIAEALRLLQESAVALGEVKATAETEFGLHVATFDTLQGTVRVNLPDDLAAGDTISGTVMAEPAGQTPVEQSKNLDQLNGYVVEIEQQKTSPKNKLAKWVIPAAASSTIALVLKTREGKEVRRVPIPVNPKPDEPGHGYQTPSVGQTGRPFEVKGRFDGDAITTGVQIASKTAKVLAESPRKVVAQVPGDVIGNAQIEVKKKEALVAKCAFRSIGVRLSAGKLNLIRGETSVLTLTVLGMDGMDAPVSVRLTNQSPWVIRLQGGQAQRLVIGPSQVQGGTYTITRTLTGVRAGGFGINAVVERAGLSSNRCG